MFGTRRRVTTARQHAGIAKPIGMIATFSGSKNVGLVHLGPQRLTDGQ